MLDGALNLDAVLAILDEALSTAGAGAPLPPLPLQAPVDGGTAVVDYALSDREPLEGHHWLGLGYVAGTCRDREELTALQALCDVLCGDNEAPLRRCLLEAGLARDKGKTADARYWKGFSDEALARTRRSCIPPPTTWPGTPAGWRN